VVNYTMSPRALHRLREATAERGKDSTPPGLWHDAYHTVGFHPRLFKFTPSGDFIFLKSTTLNQIWQLFFFCARLNSIKIYYSTTMIKNQALNILNIIPAVKAPNKINKR
jgi:hypothetical protein